ncbi:TrmB family transcriptional regulator [Streptomyces sp. NPDC057486]|uniref:TrmB family transcriptional regulator n=1 Tax=Streptomyces sp. NPDC057486 TaxID=3346145 RepID=UPI0036AAE19C
MLGALGLTDVETTVYAELVRRGSCGIQELPALCALHSTDVEIAVRGLAEKGLVTVSADSRAHVTAAPPDIAGEVLLLRRMQELHSARVAIGRLADDYRRSAREQAEGLPVEFTPDEAVRQRLDQIQRRARSEVLMFDKPPYLSLNNSSEIEQLAAGVRYRTIYDRRAVERPGGLDRIQRYVTAGEQARLAPSLPIKMVVVDRELAILPALDGGLGGPGGSALVHPSPLLDALVELFERLWGDGLPVEASGTAPGELDSADVQLLTLLLSGLTDEVIGRRLGVGRRTVLRRARSLMDRAGVDSRMQLGWYAARHDWVTFDGAHDRPSGTPDA